MSNLPEGWVETTLGEIADVVSGSTPSTKKQEYWNGSIPWITPKDLSGYSNRFISKGEKSITPEGLKNSSARLLPKNTVLFSSRAPIGYVAIAEQELTTNQGFKNLICNNAITYYQFLYYWLIRNADYIEKLSSGSTFSEASASLMRSLDIKLPPLPEQKAIADLLSSFDEKIELLREQNKTLETLAQTIFKEWFVHFNFPDQQGKPYRNNGGAMVESELGLIPKGWRVGKLGEVVDIFDSKRIPLSSNERQKRQGIYPYYGATKAMDYIDGYLFDGTYLLMAEDGSVMDDKGYPFLQYVWGKFWVNNHTHILQGKNGFSTEALYVFLKKRKVASIVNGAVQLKINQKNLMNFDILIPANDVLQSFNELLQPIFEKVKNNSSQIQNLSKTRDTLLPKLMNGQIRVKF